MSKIIFLVLFLFSNPVFAKKESFWNFWHSFNLKKDKIASVYINYIDSSKNGNNPFVLKFRWTLFANNNLILLSNYMNYPHQYVLRKQRSQDRVRIKLLADANDYNGKTYALIVFSGFNKAKNQATLDVYIKDQANRIRVDFKK